MHGTTLATNAIIERKGAKTALVATEGFRDSLEMAQENRFEQYDIFIEKPEPLVPRTLRFTVPERIDVPGGVRLALDEAAVEALAARSKAKGVEAIAIGFLHSYANPAHERRTARSWREAARRAHLHVVRGLPRGARVRALLDDRRQRLCPAADGPLSRAPAGARPCGGLRLPALPR